MIAIGMGLVWAGYTIGIWGYCLVQGYDVTFASLFGTSAGSTPVLPNSYLLPSNGVLIAVEVFTSTSPWVLSATLMGTSSVTSLRSYALFQPRLGSLSTVSSGNRP